MGGIKDYTYQNIIFVHDFVYIFLILVFLKCKYIMKIKKYYIGFYRYDDSKTWQRTNLNEDEKELRAYLENLQYIDKFSINIRNIELPE